MPTKKTHDEFANECRYFPIELLEKYTGGRQRILVLCKECGNKWRIRVDHLLSGRKCPLCSKESMKRRNMKTTEECSYDMKKIGLILKSKYNGRSEKVSIECIKCGYEWSAYPTNKLSCKKCANIACSEKMRKPQTPVFDDGFILKYNVCGKIVTIDKSNEHLITHSIRFNSKGYPLTGRKLIHKLIMPEHGSIVDHIDRNPANNLKSNLRYVTKSQNSMNAKVRRDSGTGVRGIGYNRNKKLFVVNICKDRENRYVGCYKSKQDAIVARKQAEKELFGEYAPA